MEILNTLHQFDLRLLTRVFRQGEKRMVIPLARAVSHSGDGYLHLLVTLMLWLLQVPGYQSFTLLLAIALVIERALYFTLKNSLKRRRPQQAVPGFHSLIKASDQFSFPSGHSSGAFLLATALIVLIAGSSAVLFLWAVSVALSRVLLGVHFPGDTVAGAFMGSSTALFTASWLGLL